MKKKAAMPVTEPTCPWETGELGDSVEHAKPVSREHAAAVDESLGLQLISIRLPRSLLEELKYLAEREGLGYQPLIRRVLVRYASHEFKSLAMEQFAESKRPEARPIGATPPQDTYDEPRVACAR